MFAQQFPTLADFDAYVATCIRLASPHAPASLGSSFSTVTTSSFGGTVTPSGTTNPGGVFRWKIQIQTGGAVGTATFKMSTDGGLTYGTLQTTAASMTDATTGITLAFSGSFTANGTATFFNVFMPQALWLDSAGNIRHVIDHNGYPMGRRREFREEWNIDPTPGSSSVTTNATWYFAGRWFSEIFGTGANISAGIDAFGNGFGRYASLNTSTPNSNIVILTSQPWMIYQTWLTLVCEFTVACVQGANNQTLQIGLGDGSGNASAAANAIWFTKTSAQTNWQATTMSASSSNSIDTGVAPVTDIFQRMRIEFHGSGTPIGTAAGGNCALFFINEALVAATKTDVPATGAGLWMNFDMTATNTAGLGGTQSFAVGPILAVWNETALSLPPL